MAAELDVVTIGVVTADILMRPVGALPPKGALAFVPEMETRMGGMAGVTAAVLCQLGARAGFVGKLGRDGLGDFILKTLERHRVDTTGIIRTEDYNSSATLVLVDAEGERTFLHHMGTNAQLTDDEIEMSWMERASIVHWAGPGIMPALEGAPVARLFERAQKAGLTTSMDTCFDGGGVWFPHIEAVLPHLNMAMTSLEEARHYTGRETADEIADFFLDHGPTTALVKQGPDGMLVKTREERFELAAHDVEVVDTTGAGDAACAGYLYGTVHDWSVERCARIANAVGAITVQAMGGCEAGVTLERAQRMMEND